MAATNRAFRAEPNNEHAYDHIQLFNRQSSGAPAANRAYRDDNRPNRPQPQQALGQRTLFAMIALFALSVLVAVATLILTITISMSVKDRTEGASNVKGDF